MAVGRAAPPLPACRDAALRVPTSGCGHPLGTVPPTTTAACARCRRRRGSVDTDSHAHTLVTRAAAPAGSRRPLPSGGRPVAGAGQSRPTSGPHQHPPPTPGRPSLPLAPSPLVGSPRGSGDRSVIHSAAKTAGFHSLPYPRLSPSLFSLIHFSPTLTLLESNRTWVSECFAEAELTVFL